MQVHRILLSLPILLAARLVFAQNSIYMVAKAGAGTAIHIDLISTHNFQMIVNSVRVPGVAIVLKMNPEADRLIRTASHGNIIQTVTIFYAKRLKNGRKMPYEETILSDCSVASSERSKDIETVKFTYRKIAFRTIQKNESK